MANKIVDPNAKKALELMKMEISGELGLSEIVNGAEKTSYQNGIVGGQIGGRMSKRLVQKGEEILKNNYK